MRARKARATQAIFSFGAKSAESRILGASATCLTSVESGNVDVDAGRASFQRLAAYTGAFQSPSVVLPIKLSRQYLALCTGFHQKFQRGKCKIAEIAS